MSDEDADRDDSGQGTAEEFDPPNAALLGAASVVRGLLAEASRSEVLTRHQAGRVLRDVAAAPHTYGTGAIASLARILGTHEGTLYRHMRVAGCWSVSEMETVSGLANCFGLLLSWSHFAALADVADAEIRRELLDTCLAGGWSVRELRARIKGPRREKPPTAIAEPDTVRVALEEGIEMASRAAMDVSVFSEALSERVADSNVKVDDHLLARTIAVYEDLIARTSETLAKLNAVSRISERHARPEPRRDPSQETIEDTYEFEDEEPPPPPDRARHRRR